MVKKLNSRIRYRTLKFRFCATAYLWSPKFNRHLLLMHVPQREDILMHPANDALQELKGCIAPVSLISGAGKGLRSRQAVDALVSRAYRALIKIYC